MSQPRHFSMFFSGFGDFFPPYSDFFKCMIISRILLVRELTNITIFLSWCNQKVDVRESLQVLNTPPLQKCKLFFFLRKSNLQLTFGFFSQSFLFIKKSRGLKSFYHPHPGLDSQSSLAC